MRKRNDTLVGGDKLTQRRMNAYEHSMIIRPFADSDAPAVRDLFIRVNRHLAPYLMFEAFEAYIARSLKEEIDHIPEYYGKRNGLFFVADFADRVVGMYGLESVCRDAMELRRMYVDPSARGHGIGRSLLAHAEKKARALNKARLILSTSELQTAALSLYRAASYIQIREEVSKGQSNKELGGGLRRFHFEKLL